MEGLLASLGVWILLYVSRGDWGSHSHYCSHLRGLNELIQVKFLEQSPVFIIIISVVCLIREPNGSRGQTGVRLPEK